MDKKIIAMLAYEVDRSYSQSLREKARPEWDKLSDDIRQSMIDTVEERLSSRRRKPAEQHQHWLQKQLSDGWKYGESFDADAKTDPLIAEFSTLPQAVQGKMYIFTSIVDTLARFRTDEVLKFHVGVKYIGRKPEWKDHLYGTGLTFTQGAVEFMPENIAARFLQHTDMFEATEETSHDGYIPTQPPPEFVKNEELERELDVMDEFETMTKGAMQRFAWSNYKIKLSDKMTATEMRVKLRDTVSNYGL